LLPKVSRATHPDLEPPATRTRSAIAAKERLAEWENGSTSRMAGLAGGFKNFKTDKPRVAADLCLWD